MNTLAIFDLVWIIIQLVLFVLTIAAVWKVFLKAGEKGWKAIIPFYNFYTAFKITGRSGWWFLATLLPTLPYFYLFRVSESFSGWDGFGIAILIWLTFAALLFLVYPVVAVFHYDMARSFGKGLWFTLGLIFLPFIFWPILGFSDLEYLGPAAKASDVGGAQNHAHE